MTQEEKDLLLKDLCARLPYDVIIKNKYSHIRYNFNSLIKDKDGEYLIDGMARLDEIEIYLRPMSSMTDEEREEWTDLFNSELDKLMSIEDEKQAEDLAPNYFASSHSASVDWLNKKMFDYRKLIPMGLALEAPEDLN